MIALTFEQAVAGYCGFFIVFLLGGWTFLGRRTAREGREQPVTMWQCAVCTVVYTTPAEEMMNECPRCGCLNKKGEEPIDDYRDRYRGR